jgi:hypothetical protein
LHLVVPERAQHPPHARGGVGAVLLVVDDHVGAGRDAPLAEARAEVLDARERVAASHRAVGRIANEIGLEVDKQRAGEMRLAVALARIRSGARVDQDDVLEGCQLDGIEDGVERHGASLLHEARLRSTATARTQPKLAAAS